MGSTKSLHPAFFFGASLGAGAPGAPGAPGARAGTTGTPAGGPGAGGEAALTTSVFGMFYSNGAEI